MSTDVREGQAVSLRFDPPARWASPTGLVLDPSGTTLETPTPTVNSYSGTVASATERDVLTLDDSTGLAVGDLVEVADDSWGTALSLVRYVDGNEIGLVESLPGVPDAAATVRGADITLAVAAISDRDKGYRAIVRNGNDELRRVFHVVHSPFTNPISARRVREYVEHWWPADPLLDDEYDLQRVADAAGRRLRSRLQAARVYPHAIWDHDDLIEPGEVAMQLELVERNLLPGQVDAAEYKRMLNFELRDRVGDLLAGILAHDEDEDNDLSDLEVSGFAFGGLER